MDVMRRTSKFGLRTHPVTGAAGTFHSGVDYAASTGTPLRAIADGVVVVSTTTKGGVNVGYGHYIVVEHDVKGIGKFCSIYAHLNRLGLPRGTRVKKGDVVAHSGNTGSSTGPHLHFEIRNTAYNVAGFWNRATNGRYLNAIDPEPFLKILQKEEEKVQKLPTQSKYFDDVDQAWIAEATDFLYEKEITKGKGNRIFDPGSPITRGEVAVLIYRVVKFMMGGK